MTLPHQNRPVSRWRIFRTGVWVADHLSGYRAQVFRDSDQRTGWTWVIHDTTGTRIAKGHALACKGAKEAAQATLTALPNPTPTFKPIDRRKPWNRPF